MSEHWLFGPEDEPRSMFLGPRPFSGNEFVPNNDGTRSTERTMTVQIGDEIVLIPIRRTGERAERVFVLSVRQKWRSIFMGTGGVYNKMVEAYIEWRRESGERNETLRQFWDRANG